MGDQKNLILAIVISGAILIGWQTLIMGPQEEAREAREAARQEEQQAALPEHPGSAAPTRGSE